MAEIIDEKGNIVPNANDVMANFEFYGIGEIAGVGSSNPSDM
jgi:beta-galactosidase